MSFGTWFGVPFSDSRILDKNKYVVITRDERSRLYDLVIEPILGYMDRKVVPIGPLEGLSMSTALLMGYVYLFWLIDPSFTGEFGWFVGISTALVIIVYYIMISFTSRRLHEKPFYHFAFIVVEILGIIHLSILSASVTRIGKWFALFSFVSSFTAIYAVVWESTFTTRLKYEPPFLPTDIHLFSAIASVVAAVFPSCWMIIGILSLILFVGCASLQVVRSIRLHLVDPELNGRIWKEWIPWACVVSGCFVWVGSSVDAFSRHPHPFLITEVLLGGYVLARMILDVTYKRPFQYIHAITLLPLLVGLLDALGLPDSVTLGYVVYTIVLSYFVIFIEVVRKDIYT